MRKPGRRIAVVVCCLGISLAASAQYVPPPTPPTPPMPPAPPAPPPGPQPQPPTSTRVVKLASLDGAQETPPKQTQAFGAGVLEVDEATGAVRGFVVSSGLVNPIAAHVHLQARGTAGAIIVPLTGGPDLWVVPDGVAPLTAAQIAAFRAGQLYFNVHTQANPDGEIRGQLDKTGTLKLASLDGAQEVPAATTQGFGAGILAVDATTGAPAGFVVSSGVTGTAAQVHQQVRGMAGYAIAALAGGPSLWVVPDAAPPLTADERAAFAIGALYYDVHTAAKPDGELRGQLDKAGTLGLASLSGAQETPPVTTNAFGGGVCAVDQTSGQVSGFVVAAAIPTGDAAHVHSAPRGSPGSIIVPMTGGPETWVIPDGAAPLPANLRTQLGTGGLYENVHTPAHPEGEIRGQLQ